MAKVCCICTLTCILCCWHFLQTSAKTGQEVDEVPLVPLVPLISRDASSLAFDTKAFLSIADEVVKQRYSDAWTTAVFSV